MSTAWTEPVGLSPSLTNPEVDWRLALRPPRTGELLMVTVAIEGDTARAQWTLRAPLAPIDIMFGVLRQMFGDGVAEFVDRELSFAIDLIAGGVPRAFFTVTLPAAAFYDSGLVAGSFESLMSLVSEDGALSVVSARVLVPTSRVAEPVSDEPAGSRSVACADPDVTGIPVIVAVIDAGIGFANSRFRKPANDKSAHRTRFESVWIMDTPPAGSPTAGDWTRAGRQIGSAAIDSKLAQANGDDAETYRLLGVLDPAVEIGQPLAFSRTHGTHVFDLAAGADPSEPNPPGDYLLGVQLPRDLVRDSSSAFLDSPLSAALNWILDRSLAIRAAAGDDTPAPALVLNFSWGITAGPADGTHFVERRLAEFRQDYLALVKGDIEIVLPAGNSYAGRQYAAMSAKALEPLRWRVLPDDKTASVVQVWLPPVPIECHQAGQQVVVRLVPPAFAPEADMPVTAPGQKVDWQLFGKPVARVYHQCLPGPGTTVREVVTVAIAPTASDDDDAALAPAGEWQICITRCNGLADDALVQCRVQRDDTVPTFRPNGRQSYFSMPDYRRFEADSGRPLEDVDSAHHDLPGATVRRAGTLNIYASATDVATVVGGYRHSDGQAARYSSAGPANPGGRPGPDAAAISDDSFVHQGVIASGTMSGSTFRQAGTSVAAPVIARRLAVLLKDGKGATDLIEEIVAAERHRARSPQRRYPLIDTDGSAPRRRLGNGRLPRDGVLAHRVRRHPG